MNEVEILVRVLDPKAKALAALRKLAAKRILQSLGKQEVIDVYYFHPKKKEMQVRGSRFPIEWLRVRTKGKQCFLAYKKDHVDAQGCWLFSDEHETEVSDERVIRSLLEGMGFSELVMVQNTKHVFMTSQFEVVLEDVRGLGLFLEVEMRRVREGDGVQAMRKEIQDFVDHLRVRVGKELHVGKPELLLKQQSLQKRDPAVQRILRCAGK